MCTWSLSRTGILLGHVKLGIERGLDLVCQALGPTTRPYSILLIIYNFYLITIYVFVSDQDSWMDSVNQ